MKKRVTLSLELAKTMFETGGVARQFALENFTQEELTKKELPKTWKELENISGFYINDISKIKRTYKSGMIKENKNIFPTEDLARASLALAQLLQLRDRYNGDWEPDWSGYSNNNYVIFRKNDNLSTSNFKNCGVVLAFKTSEIRDEFFKNFKELLEIAKPLL